MLLFLLNNINLGVLNMRKLFNRRKQQPKQEITGGMTYATSHDHLPGFEGVGRKLAEAKTSAEKDKVIESAVRNSVYHLNAPARRHAEVSKVERQRRVSQNPEARTAAERVINRRTNTAQQHQL